jgi:hypothetical protein
MTTFRVKKSDVTRMLAAVDYSRLVARDQGYFGDSDELETLLRSLERQAARKRVGPARLREDTVR